MNVILLISALLASSLGLALKGCSPGNRPGKEAVEADSPAPRSIALDQGLVTGRFTFEDVSPTLNADGTIGPTVTRLAPVRFAQVMAADENDANPALLSSAPVFTDADGAFSLPVPFDTPFRPMLFFTTAGTGRAVEVRSPGGQLTAAVVKSLGASFVVRRGAPPLEIDVEPIKVIEDQRAVGAANILDVATTGVDAIAAAGAVLPTATFIYDPANTDGSFFRENEPAVNGPAIFIRGGDSRNDDTDEFDDAVILHELGHLIAFAISKDSSLGGAHFLQDAANPPLAWSEGLATFLSALMRGDPRYADTQAILGSTTGFTQNLETRALSSVGNTGARGLRSELSVSEILWDLVDGAEGRPNADAESSAATATQAVTALRALRGTNLYVSLNDYLGQVVSSGVIDVGGLNALLNAPEDQNLDFPPAAADVFPTRLVQNAVPVADVVETRSLLGLGTATEDAANRFYVLDLASEVTLTATLTLDAPADGRNATGTNVDLVLLTDTNADALDTGGIAIAPQLGSREANPERIPPAGASPRIPPGRYILWVHGRDDIPGGPLNFSVQRVTYALAVGP